MAEDRLAFHAAPPGGWLNDPNGLIFADGAYRLFAQHRLDAPAFRETGWARFSSPDLLRWHYDGMVIAPVHERWAYSGCVVSDAGGGQSAFHTEHRRGRERQVERVTRNAGLTWSAPKALIGLGPPGANRRDPFVFEDRGGWAMLVAEPCDWHRWPGQPPSRLTLYRSPDRESWHAAGTIGPWRPRGVMWEVPVLARVDGRDVLMVSEVDRRDGGAACSVRGWVGTLLDDDFRRDDPTDSAPQPLDLGPDFYAMIPSSPVGWPLPTPLYVGWVSNWGAARTTPWPGFAGGPIGLPRTLSLAGDKIVSAPAEEVVARFSQPLDRTPAAGLARVDWTGRVLELAVRRGPAVLELKLDLRSRTLALARKSRPSIACWSAAERLDQNIGEGPSEALVFVDGPVIEIFVGGVAVSIYFGIAQGPVSVSGSGDNERARVKWFGLN